MKAILGKTQSRVVLPGDLAHTHTATCEPPETDAVREPEKRLTQPTDRLLKGIPCFHMQRQAAPQPRLAQWNAISPGASRAGTQDAQDSGLNDGLPREAS